MALREKLNNLAVTATSRANTAIENGKLNLKISSEERKITEFTLNLGELLVDRLDAGETFDDEIMALYSSIQAARDVIIRARADIEANNRQPEDTGAAAETKPLSVCTQCGAQLAENANYCSACGAKVEPPEEEPIPTCGQCGAQLEPNANFCNQCGSKVPPAAE